MANLLRQRFGALLARPRPTPLQTSSRDAGVTKRFFAAKAHQEDDAGRYSLKRIISCLDFAAKAHQEDDAEETHKWRSVTIAAYIMCISLGVYTFSNEEHNEIHSPAYSYLHIRNKEFPWGEDGLFEYKHSENEEGH